MTETIVSHGYTLEISADEKGAGFDIKNLEGKVFASEWLDSDTFESARAKAFDYARQERQRSRVYGMEAL